MRLIALMCLEFAVNQIWDVETGSFGFIEEQTVTSLLHHASLRRSPLGPPKISRYLQAFCALELNL